MIIGIDTHNLEGNRTGVGRYLFNLLREWSKLSSKFKVQSSKFMLYFKHEIPTDIPKSDLFEFKLLKVSSTAKFMHWDLPRAAKKDKIDILFCPGYVAPIFYKGKIALALHDIIYEAHPEWFSWPSAADKILLKWVSRKAAQKAAIIFVPSEFTRQEVLRCYKVAPEKVKLIYLAADPNLIPSMNELNDLAGIKKKYRIEGEFAFYVGSIFSRRHLAEIIKAFSQVAMRHSGYQLLIVGKDYTKEKNIGQLIAEQNDALSREVVVRVDLADNFELKLLYSACAFFIWLSDYEGFGLPPLEAMSAGAPVIASHKTSLKEVMGEAALLIENNSDVDEIYQAMERMISDENLRVELARRGREQTGKFSWEKCAQETFKALSSA